MSSVFGGGSSKQTVSNEPWSGVRPYMTDIYQNAQNLYRNQSPQYYPGQTFAPMDPLQMASQQMALSSVFGGSSLPQWFAPQMPDAYGNLSGPFSAPINGPPVSPPPSSFSGSMPSGGAFGGLSPPGNNAYIPGASPMFGGQQGQPTLPQPQMPSAPYNQQMGERSLGVEPYVRTTRFDAANPYVASQTPEYGPERQARRRGLQQAVNRETQKLNIDYDRSQFSDSLKEFLARRPGWERMSRDQQNYLLNRTRAGNLDQMRAAYLPRWLGAGYGSALPPGQ